MPGAEVLVVMYLHTSVAQQAGPCRHGTLTFGVLNAENMRQLCQLPSSTLAYAARSRVELRGPGLTRVACRAKQYSSGVRAINAFHART